MGNQSSSQQQTLDGLQEQQQSDEGGETTQAVAITPELQGEIASDFQKELMESQRQYELQEQQQQPVESIQSELERIHKQLDAKLETLSAEFSDKSVAMEYDAKALLEKYVHAQTGLDAQSPCLEARSNFVSCQKTKKQSECEIFVEALQNCVSKTIAQ